MKRLLNILAIVLLVAVTAGVTCVLTFRTAYANLLDANPVEAKMQEVWQYLEAFFVDEYEDKALISAAADGAAAAMVEATGDRWSYYLPQSEMQAHEEQRSNSYVGVGIVIRETDEGLLVASVTEGSPAEAAGVQLEDVLIEVDGNSILELSLDEVVSMVRGEEGTPVSFTVLRAGQPVSLTITRALVIDRVAQAKMLKDGIGLVTIANFDLHCAEQTLSCVNSLLQQGAKAVVFDVRYNPGGYKTELVEILDALLPEGEIFRTVDYGGYEETDYSDADCMELPMAVLVNGDSYSAAEFFAAALQEYEAALIVGTRTCGKGNFQYTYTLSDGSGLNLSVGKYYTPKGRSLTDVGVEPDHVVELDQTDAADLYYGMLSEEDDEQLQTAMNLLRQKIS